jgi:hypothetical protein
MLKEAKFLGDAPEYFGNGVFENCDDDFKILYYPGKTGWTTPSWRGYPCYPIEEDNRTPFEKAVELLEKNPPFLLPDELLGDTTKIIPYLESEIAVIVESTGLDPIEVRRWESINGGDGEFYLMDPDRYANKNYKLKVLNTDLIQDPFKEAVTILESRAPIEVPPELNNEPMKIIDFLTVTITELVAETGLTPIEVKQWEKSDGGDGEFYLMDPDRAANNNYKLSVVYPPN